MRFGPKERIDFEVEGFRSRPEDVEQSESEELRHNLPIAAHISSASQVASTATIATRCQFAQGGCWRNK